MGRLTYADLGNSALRAYTRNCLPSILSSSFHCSTSKIHTMRRQLTRIVLASPTQGTIRPWTQYSPFQVRCQSTAPAHAKQSDATLSPRWLSDLKTRIGKCFMFGLSTEQTNEACSVLQEIALDWRGLVAGSEGFLTTKERMGLYRQAVVWGEMVAAHPRFQL